MALISPFIWRGDGPHDPNLSAASCLPARTGSGAVQSFSERRADRQSRSGPYRRGPTVCVEIGAAGDAGSAVWEGRPLTFWRALAVTSEGSDWCR